MAIRNLINVNRFFPSKISMFSNPAETSKYPPVSNQTRLFEADYGEIPARICCGNVTVCREDIESVITPDRWVNDRAIRAVFRLLKSRR